LCIDKRVSGQIDHLFWDRESKNWLLTKINDIKLEKVVVDKLIKIFDKITV
jgi:hypothetical protein